eukprot:TRINITY_DN1777_c0_g1_i1.p1 TRINITY_DN1777_c0_g1~~TRINITY_DN1777_c0_g1_i1.p1  ORF type:complete len:582 (-),score=144.25 TRINITY_DN1777_c0_g1_i1:73-1818(-)
MAAEPVFPVHLKLDIGAGGAVPSHSPAGVHSSSSSSSSKPAVSLESQSGKPAKKKVNTKLYKTNLCRTFSRTGQCPYGAKCQFAHGEGELRPVPPEFEDIRNNPSEQLSISSPVAVSSLFAGSNHPQVISPRVESLSLDGVLSPKDKMSFAAVSQMKVADVASLSLKSANQMMSSPSIVGASPRVALLNLGSADVSAEKPIPEGARVDCDPKLYKTELCRSFSKDGVCRYGNKCQFAHGIEELRPSPHGASKILKLKSPESRDSSQFTSPAISPSPLIVDHEPRVERIVVEDLGKMSLEEEKQPNSPRDGDRMGSPGPRIKDPRVYKTELCQKFKEQGECPYGLKCQFAHGEKELRPRLPTSPTTKKSPSSPRADEDEKSADRAQDDVNNDSDKRSPDPKLYKTELCRSFNRTGYCRYGLKCQFAHGIHELRPSPRLFNAAMKIGIDMGSPVPVKLNLAPVMPAQADLVSEADVKYTPVSPRNLSGSPIVGSPSNKMLKFALGMPALPPADESKQAMSNGMSPRIRAIGAEASSLPKASPTARQVFSFPAPVNIEDVSKMTRSGTPSSSTPRASSMLSSSN